MKTIKLLAAAFVAAGLMSCGGNTTATSESTDSTAVAATSDSVAVGTPEELQSQLTQALESGDKEQVESLLTTWKQKIEELQTSGDVASLQSYSETLQKYVSENMTKLQEAGVTTTTLNDAVQSAVQAATQTASGSIDDAAAKANQAIDEATKNMPEAVKNAAKEQVDQVKEQAKAKAQEKADEAKAKAQEKVDEAKAKAQDKVDEAKSKAQDKAKSALKGLGL